jgi:hypothetical protein
MALFDRADTQIWKIERSSCVLEEERAHGCPLERWLALFARRALGGRKTSQYTGFERVLDRLLLEHLHGGPGELRRRRFIVVVDAATGPPLRLRVCSLSHLCVRFESRFSRMRLLLLIALRDLSHPVPCVHWGHIWLAFTLS